MRAPLGVAVLLAALAAQAETVRGYVTDRRARLQATVRLLGASGSDGGWVECARDVPSFRDNLVTRGPPVLAETKTNDAGEFDFAYQPAPDSVVEIAAHGYRPFVFQAEHPGRPGRGVDRMAYIVDDPVEMVAATLVQLDGGTPISGATLRWRASGTGDVQTVRTDGRGRARVEAGRCLLAEAPGFEPAVLGGARRLALARAKRVVARVLLEGRPGEAQVEVRSAAGRAVLATDGGVVVVDSARAPYTLVARAQGLLAAATVTEAQPADLVLDLRPAARLRLVTAIGRSEIHTVSVGETSRTIFGWDPSSLEFELPRGTYLVRSFFRPAAGPKRINLAKWVTLDRDREEPLDLWMLPLSGTVVTPQGAPAEAEVVVESDLELLCGMGGGICSPLQRYRQTARATDGGFSLQVPTEGEYRLTALAPGRRAVGRATAKVPGAPVRLALEPSAHAEPPLPRWFITGTVRDEQGKPADVSVCAVLGGGGGCVDARDGGFALDVFISEVSYRVAVTERTKGAELYSAPVRVRAGEHVELVARPWKPRSVRVTDRAGAPVALPKWLGARSTMRLLYPRTETLLLPGFLPLTFDSETVGPTLTLERLPLAGTVRDSAGRPAEGAAVSLLCESPVSERPVKWSRYTDDLGGVTTWTWWPEGVRCIAATTRVDAAGRFSFTEVNRPFVAVEVRQGAKVTRVPYGYGQPLDLVVDAP